MARSGNFIDLTGKAFGKLKVLGIARLKPRVMWLCQCECGRQLESRTDGLKRRTSDWGCCKCRENTHKMPEYTSWRSMLARCGNPNDPYYARYGGRGIKVCDQWLHDFHCFLRDLGLRPTIKHTLDRVNNNGNYEPGNCRWATCSEQANNRHNSVCVTYQGQTKTISQWAEVSGINKITLYWRYHQGWRNERLFAKSGESNG